jgi:UDP-2-acetamido-2,6-beta-L-arabino-hexul-4-ose reductase
MEAASTLRGGRVTPMPGRLIRVSAVRDLLTAQAARYATGEFPDLSDPFERDMFNTYRSYTFPESFPMPIAGRSDDRGSLFECVRAGGGPGQTFVSHTRPGVTRGEHYHLKKVERFVVISGSGRISLRKLFSDDVVSFPVGGEAPAIVDMPTMWAHSITNTGSSDLVTLFWTDHLFDPERPDTYAEPVLQAVSVS